MSIRESEVRSVREYKYMWGDWKTQTTRCQCCHHKCNPPAQIISQRGKNVAMFLCADGFCAQMDRDTYW